MSPAAHRVWDLTPEQTARELISRQLMLPDLPPAEVEGRPQIPVGTGSEYARRIILDLAWLAAFSISGWHEAISDGDESSPLDLWSRVCQTIAQIEAERDSAGGAE